MKKLQAFSSDALDQAALLGQEIVLGQELVIDTIFSNSRNISHTSFWAIYFNKRTCRGLGA